MMRIPFIDDRMRLADVGAQWKSTKHIYTQSTSTPINLSISRMDEMNSESIVLKISIFLATEW